MTEQRFVCRLTPQEEREWRETTGRALYAAAREVRKEPDGMSLHLPGSDDWLEKAAGLVRSERRCCPFLTFTLRVDSDETGIELRMSAPPEAVSLLHEEVDVQQRLAAE